MMGGGVRRLSVEFWKWGTDLGDLGALSCKGCSDVRVVDVGTGGVREGKNVCQWLVPAVCEVCQSPVRRVNLPPLACHVKPTAC